MYSRCARHEAPCEVSNPSPSSGVSIESSGVPCLVKALLGCEEYLPGDVRRRDQEHSLAVFGQVCGDRSEFSALTFKKPEWIEPDVFCGDWLARTWWEHLSAPAFSAMTVL